MNIKEQEFKDLKAAWALAVNDKDNYPTKDGIYGNKVEGELKNVHYMLYNLIRGKHIAYGFGELTEGMETAKRRLTYWNFQRLLWPFGGFVTAEEVEKIQRALRPHR